MTTTGSMASRSVKRLGIEPRAHPYAQNRRALQANLPCCPTVRILAQTADETDALRETTATVGHNHLQCLASLIAGTTERTGE